MAKVVATNKDQAQAQLEKIETGLSDKIDFNVDANDKDFFVVAQVKRRHRPAQEDYVSTVTRQIYDARGYDNVKNKAKGLGLHAVILIHDPIAQKAKEAEEEAARLEAERAEQERIAKEKEEAEKAQKAKEEAEAKAKAKAEAEKKAKAEATKKANADKK